MHQCEFSLSFSKVIFFVIITNILLFIIIIIPRWNNLKKNRLGLTIPGVATHAISFPTRSMEFFFILFNSTSYNKLEEFFHEKYMHTMLVKMSCYSINYYLLFCKNNNTVRNKLNACIFILIHKA